MKKTAWKKLIIKNCEDAGTYREYFDPVIDTLALIMEMRDDAVKQFDESNRETVVEYTNKGGNTNMTKNPALVLINELNRDALTHWKELGLTPSGLKKINEKAMDPEKRDGFAEAMAKLGI